MGRETEESYGEFVDYTIDKSAHWRILTRRALYVHHGFMTMEVQARIYKFLVDSCFEILRLDKAQGVSFIQNFIVTFMQQLEFPALSGRTCSSQDVHLLVLS